MEDRTEAVDLKDLKDLWKRAIVAKHRAERAAAEARVSAATFDVALALEKERLCVAPGLEIDVLGDGKVKPEADVKKSL